MCLTCGCGGTAAHEHEHEAGGDHHHGPADPAHIGHDHGGGDHHHEHESRTIRLEQELLAKNDAYAAQNRRLLRERGIFTVNLVSSPGSGKTTLLVRTIEELSRRVPVAVIEGDQQTSRDAERIRATGAPAVQITTGKACHLDAHMVGHAIEELAPRERSILFIENVGNLICPAAFDLGEDHKIAILSVTEGDDKPLKYPDMFHVASLMLLSKIDLLPHVDFDTERSVAFARRIRPEIEVLRVSARTGDGLDAWLAWLLAGRERASADALHLTACGVQDP